MGSSKKDGDEDKNQSSGNGGGGADPGGNGNGGGSGNVGSGGNGGTGEGKPGGGGSAADVDITVVVNGTPTMVHARPNDRFGEVRKQALDQTSNIAQPPENWELKNEAGETLDPDKKVGSQHFGAAVTLFLSLSAGVAGA